VAYITYKALSFARWRVCAWTSPVKAVPHHPRLTLGDMAAERWTRQVSVHLGHPEKQPFPESYIMYMMPLWALAAQ
jgi:hypothetical protein